MSQDHFLFSRHSRDAAVRHRERHGGNPFEIDTNQPEPVAPKHTYHGGDQAHPSNPLMHEAAEHKDEHQAHKKPRQPHPVVRKVVSKKEGYHLEFLAPAVKVPVVGAGIRIVKNKGGSMIEGMSEGGDGGGHE